MINYMFIVSASLIKRVNNGNCKGIGCKYRA